MNNATHTPGPWEISKHGTPDYAPQFGIYAEGSQNDHCLVRYDNAQANARLIAAAPDLLAACEAALDDFYHELDSQLRRPTEEMLVAAIAKAKGDA